MRLDRSQEVLFPESELLKLLLDALQVGMLRLELLERECLVKVVNGLALLELVHNALEMLEVVPDAPLNGSL